MSLANHTALGGARLCSRTTATPYSSLHPSPKALGTVPQSPCGNSFPKSSNLKHSATKKSIKRCSFLLAQNPRFAPQGCTVVVSQSHRPRALGCVLGRLPLLIPRFILPRRRSEPSLSHPVVTAFRRVQISKILQQKRASNDAPFCWRRI